MPEMVQAAKDAKAWACYDCGKCTATCPISRSGAGYSPRRHVLAANQGDREQILNGTLYQCLTCSLCDRRCPAEVNYTQLMLTLREVAHEANVEPECPHGGALLSVMRMMAEGGTQQDRMGWIGDELKTEPVKGDVFFWTGCTMYYDAFFGDFGISTLEGTRAAVKLMNAVGITPVVSPDERCCGHDLLWNGDRASFEKLARHNIKLVAESGAKTLVTSCGECMRTWKIDYEPYMTGKMPEIVHISQFLDSHLSELPLEKNGGKKVTFQDPCRLGRHCGVYDSPRAVLNAVPGIEVEEMRRSGKSAMCCAGGTWSHCDRFAKLLQVDRLREAKATGAEVLVTACPKCQVHFKCAMKDPNLEAEIEIEMRDVAELVAEALASGSEE